MSNEQNTGIDLVDAVSTGAAEAHKQSKVFTSEEVDGIVKHKIERTRASVEAEYADKLKSLQQPTTTQAQPPASNDVEKLSAEIERRMEAKYQKQQEEAAKQEYLREAERVSREYGSKIAAARQSGEYPDLDEAMDGFDHNAHEFLLWGANTMPNTVDIMREMANNQLKAMQWEQLARSNPGGFQKALKKFSDSIEENKAARRNVSKAPPPLSQVKSSTTGTAAKSSPDDQASLRAKYRR